MARVFEQHMIRKKAKCGGSVERGDLLLYLPVILLPTGNLLMLFFSSVDFNLLTLLLSLAGAVSEEYFFHLFLLKTILFPRIMPEPAIMLVSFLFATMHILNLRNGTGLQVILPQMICAFCFSTWAGAVVWRKGSILIPMLAHVLLNLTAMTEGTLIPLLVSSVVLADGFLLMKGNENEQ